MSETKQQKTSSYFCLYEKFYLICNVPDVEKDPQDSKYKQLNYDSVL